MCLSHDVIERNAIPVDPPLAVRDLDTFGAQFDNTDTGERILVYSLQRWDGTPQIDPVTGDFTGSDHRGRYCVDLRAANEHRCPLPLEILGLPTDATFFGAGWDQPTRRRSERDAFAAIVTAIRRHYGIWPNLAQRSHSGADADGAQP